MKRLQIHSSRKLLRIGLWLGLTALAGPFPAPAEPWQGEAEIEFHGTSTLHDFSGTVPANPFVLDLSLDGSAATLGGTAAVAVARMDTRHVRRDENMRKMFDSIRFPLVVGVLEFARLDTGTDSPVRLKLTVRDRTTAVPATIRDWRVANGKIFFTLDLTLSLRQLGLEPPVLLGILRVGDAVPVRGRVELEKQTP